MRGEDSTVTSVVLSAKRKDKLTLLVRVVHEGLGNSVTIVITQQEPTSICGGT